MLANGCRFACATNGIDWYLIDMETGKEGLLGSPFRLQKTYGRTFAKPNPWRDRFGDIPFESAGGKGSRDIIHTGRSLQL